MPGHNNNIGSIIYNNNEQTHPCLIMYVNNLFDHTNKFNLINIKGRNYKIDRVIRDNMYILNEIFEISNDFNIIEIPNIDTIYA